MTATENVAGIWESMRTDETRLIEETLHQAGLATVDSYRYNSAVIRLRVIDPRFEGMRMGQRFDIVEPVLDRLPDDISSSIMGALLLAPSELVQSRKTARQFAENVEFEEPTPSIL